MCGANYYAYACDCPAASGKVFYEQGQECPLRRRPDGLLQACPVAHQTAGHASFRFKCWHCAQEERELANVEHLLEAMETPYRRQSRTRGSDPPKSPTRRPRIQQAATESRAPRPANRRFAVSDGGSPMKIEDFNDVFFHNWNEDEEKRLFDKRQDIRRHAGVPFYAAAAAFERRRLRRDHSPSRVVSGNNFSSPTDPFLESPDRQAESDGSSEIEWTEEDMEELWKFNQDLLELEMGYKPKRNKVKPKRNNVKPAPKKRRWYDAFRLFTRD